jgi:hypothetical protein
MESEELVPRHAGAVEQSIRGELAEMQQSRKFRALKKVAMAALGSIPSVGGFLQAAVEFRDEETGQLKVNELYRQWLEEHADQMKRLGDTLAEIGRRLAQLDEAVADRIESDAFLSLVRQGFRTWDEAETEEKRILIQKLLTNAAGTKLCPDDLVRLFIDWIDIYHEAHFKVIQVVYKNRLVTRAYIWQEIYGDFPREDSAEADVFKLLIHDLSLGHVIRQHRPTTGDGRFLKKARPSRRLSASPVMKSAFDNADPYELTELGRQFVHYTMTELVPRIGESSTAQASAASEARA